ncbi:alpha/beta-hydrolase [Macroventuria anomochaeta]|uniref:Alpha/beta-hydrolase n=1 Tax=Macroventuria anomochaeta TaxID=301207 RepID=A0ACB6SGL1_9PLEO|nr:alpha/beta-hydrolase [Macroventuria anomochaeta]KAF2633118.1 alpha/beta-hydrolase [Macroventuria anomochaeta]
MIRQLQKRPVGSGAIPLFLFHDASGTISSYYTLGPMGRDVYAIADKRMESDVYESLQEKSRRYYAAIKALVPEGRILVGGWSLGGMIALQVAWIFSRDPRVNVDGVIMVDSPYPDYRHVVYLAPESPICEDGPAPAVNKLKNSIVQSVNMLHKWQPPVWRRQRQPYTVMLCATERVISEEHPALSFIDQFRDSPTLGWEERAGSVVIDKRYSIQGHHFNIFDPRNVASVTDTIATIGSDIDMLAYDDEE